MKKYFLNSDAKVYLDELNLIADKSRLIYKEIKKITLRSSSWSNYENNNENKHVRNVYVEARIDSADLELKIRELSNYESLTQFIKHLEDKFIIPEKTVFDLAYDEYNNKNETCNTTQALLELFNYLTCEYNKAFSLCEKLKLKMLYRVEQLPTNTKSILEYQNVNTSG
jgi:hypothetical protein